MASIINLAINAENGDAQVTLDISKELGFTGNLISRITDVFFQEFKGQQVTRYETVQDNRSITIELRPAMPRETLDEVVRLGTERYDAQWARRSRI